MLGGRLLGINISGNRFRHRRFWNGWVLGMALLLAVDLVLLVAQPGPHSKRTANHIASPWDKSQAPPQYTRHVLIAPGHLITSSPPPEQAQRQRRAAHRHWSRHHSRHAPRPDSRIPEGSEPAPQ